MRCSWCTQSRSRSSPRYDNYRRHEREERRFNRRDDERRDDDRRERGRSPGDHHGGGTYGRADTRVGGKAVGVETC